MCGKVVDGVATVDQIKQLIKSHYERNDERFKTIVIQIAASEAKAGHTTQARELKELIDKVGKSVVVKLNTVNPMFDISESDVGIADMVLSPELMEKIDRIILEYRKREKLRRFGLTNPGHVALERQNIHRFLPKKRKSGYISFDS